MSQTPQVSQEQVEKLKKQKQIEQIKSMGLDKVTEKKMLKALGIDLEVEPFERYDFVVNNPGNANHGKSYPLVNINRGKASKSITLWQAQTIIDNIDNFILFVEELKETLKNEGVDVEKQLSK